MRVLHFMTDAEVGGAEVMVETHARYRNLGDTYALAVLMDPGSLSPRLERVFDHVTYLGFAPSSRDLLTMIRMLRVAATEFGADVVHSHMFHADLVNALAPLGCTAKVTSVHTQGFGEGVHWMTPLIARLVSHLSWRFDSVVPVDQSAKNFAQDLGYRRLTDPIENTADFPAQTHYETSSRRFVSIARWHPVKGHRTLLEAAGPVLRSGGWTLDLIGPGVELSNSEARDAVRDAHVEDLVEAGVIRLLGLAEDIDVVLRDAAALVISSGYGEARPLVGIEALARGVPVISTDVGGCGEFVLEPGLLVAPDSPRELEKALEAFQVLGSTQRQALSERSLSWGREKFDPRSSVARYRAEYLSAISHRRARCKGDTDRNGRP